MIEREFFGVKLFSAVLAAVVISAVHIFAAEFDSREAAMIDKSLES